MSVPRDMTTYVIVTAVTLLIWVWAATETREQETFSARIEFVVPDPENWQLEPAQRSLMVTVQGSRLALDRTQEALRSPLRVDIAPLVGTKTVDVLAALREHPDIEATGVQVMSADTVSVELRMDEIVRVPARVRPHLPRVQTVGEIDVDPDEVTVSMPRGLRQQFPAELIVEPSVDQQRLDRLEPEVMHTIDAQLRLAEGLALTDRIMITPPRAKLTFALRSRIAEHTLDNVRVQLAGPPEDHRDYVVEVEDAVLRDVRIRADTSVIEQIQQQEALVVAVLHVSSREKEQRIESKPVSYFLVLYPDASGRTAGRIVDAEVAGSPEPPLIRLRIERRDAG